MSEIFQVRFQGEEYLFQITGTELTWLPSLQITDQDYTMN